MNGGKERRRKSREYEAKEKIEKARTIVKKHKYTRNKYRDVNVIFYISRKIKKRLLTFEIFSSNMTIKF